MSRHWDMGLGAYVLDRCDCGDQKSAVEEREVRVSEAGVFSPWLDMSASSSCSLRHPGAACKGGEGGLRGSVCSYHVTTVSVGRHLRREKSEFLLPGPCARAPVFGYVRTKLPKSRLPGQGNQGVHALDWRDHG